MSDVIHSEDNLSTDFSLTRHHPGHTASASLGAFEARYAANRFRLLLHGALALLVTWLIITLLLWEVDAATASPLTVLAIAAAALAVGWYLLHFWNREVLVYEHGFTYRQGSGVVRVPFAEVVSLRGRGVRRSYLSGLIQRTSYRFTVRTNQNTLIVLDDLFSRIEQLSLHLEHGINRVMRPRVERQLASDVRVPFADTLMISNEGLHAQGHTLPWAELQSFCIHAGTLSLIYADEDACDTWYALPISEVDNLRLFVDLLVERLPQQTACGESLA